jgi:membrane peptidoglycan carboxypeptidase
MASAFATLAADGERHRSHLVKTVTDADGRVLHSIDDEPSTARQAIPQQVARNVTEAMLDVASFAGIGLGDRPVAAKTGTVQHPQAGQNKDAWTVGFTPQLSTAVWVGTDFSEPIKNSAGRPVYGRMLPGSIWQTYMGDALRGEKTEQFSRFVPMGDPPVSEFFDEDGSDSGEDSEESEDGESRDGEDKKDRTSDGNGNKDGTGNRKKNGGSGDGGSTTESISDRFLGGGN